MITFHLRADANAVLTALFRTDGDSYLRFGAVGKSFEPSEPQALLNGSVRFWDYVMEGGITYSLRLEIWRRGLSTACLRGRLQP